MNVELIITIISFILAIPALISFAIYQQVQILSEPEKLFLPDEDERVKKNLDDKKSLWIEEHNWQYIKSYRLQQIHFSAWRLNRQNTFLLISFIADKQVIDFVTVFNDHQTHTTTNSIDAFLFPAKPDCCREGIRSHKLEELYQLHQHSASLVQSHLNIRTSHVELEFLPTLCQNMRQQMQYIKSLPLYPLRALYWFFIQRKKLFGETIEQQSREGKLR